MSLQAYQQAATRAESPRDLEYRLFAQVTRALMEAAKLPREDVGGRMDALDWNRRVWATLAADCSQPDNALPKPLRASLISLSIWVGKHTSLVIRNQEEFEPLIEINRMIMQGLAGDATSAAA
ncbi:flagellar biosynthesis regulator FlaF [Phenylobacterium sp. SCN 70-31]|uniref:flagellar biosynthesis regulator FlaF n=1 Tax=Phenylobacterium sp. SCN 70-31 TaxID=1660129 RepID=UPI0008683A02|nr:flagellar biosynthesis regulator FlaF [Phenylobacterium sp. SCN 70-31]ODT87492.1 MAG: flagellar biosynthesis regulator FlhF [Phenylobacterium sp. SCN 70-31]